MNVTSFKSRLILALAVLMLLASVYFWLSPAGVQAAPNVKLPVMGTERYIELNELKGRPVLVTFWATSCASCVKEIPQLIELYNKLNPKGFELVAIAMSHDRPDFVMEIKKQRNLPYLVSYDATGEISAAFGGIRVIPAMFLINPQGQIVQQKLGEINMAHLHDQILAMLKPTKASS